MTDDLILIGLVFIFVQEILGAGKCDLVDILIHFFLGHAQTVIRNRNGLVRRVHGHMDLILKILGLFKLAHKLQLL